MIVTIIVDLTRSRHGKSEKMQKNELVCSIQDFQHDLFFQATVLTISNCAKVSCISCSNTIMHFISGR